MRGHALFLIDGKNIPPQRNERETAGERIERQTGRQAGRHRYVSIDICVCVCVCVGRNRGGRLQNRIAFNYQLAPARRLRRWPREICSSIETACNFSPPMSASAYRLLVVHGIHVLRA